MKASTHVRRTRLILIIAALLIALAAAALIYANDYYRALPYTAPAMADGGEIPVGKFEGFTIYGDSTHGTGLIFYPGGKVDTEAYAPLLYGLAQRGVCCVAADMPLRLAALKPNAADDIIRQLASVERWFICGHSLGGAMAAKYASAHQDEISGLILLAAYPTDALGEAFPVLSLRGSGDGVLDMAKYEPAKPLAPAMREIVIEGGNHAQFGNYGVQSGDGAALIAPEAQWSEAIDAIAAFCEEP